MKKRILSILMAIVMVVGLLPATALAAEVTCTCGTDDPAFHATDCPAYTAPDDPQCFCAEKCTDDNINVWCDICGVLGAAECLGEDTAAPYAADFDLYIGGVQVNSTNMNDITAAINEEFGENIASGDASYDVFTNTLTLEGFSYMGEGDEGEGDEKAAITSNGALNIHLIGANSVRLTDTDGYAIYSGDGENGISITAESGASLELSGIGDSCSGVPTLGEGLKMWDRNGEEIGDDGDYGDYTMDTYLYIAAEPKGAAAATSLSIGGKTITDAKLCIVGEDDDGYAAFDPRTNTLTLKDYDLDFEGESAISYKGTDTLNIRLIGENSVTNAGETGYGLYAAGSLTLSGDGSLEVSGGNYGVYTNGSIITGGKVVAVATASSGIGVYAGGDITITGGVVEAYGTTGPSGIGVSAGGSIKITGGSVVAQGDSFGMSAGVNITIGGGEVSAFAIHGTGVSADGSIKITGGTTEAGGAPAFNKEPTIADGWAAYNTEDPENPILIDPEADLTGYSNVTVKQDTTEAYPISVGDEYFVRTGTDGEGNTTFNPIEGGNGTATLTVDETNPAKPVFTLTLNNFTYSGPAADGAPAAIYLSASYADRMNTFNLVLVGDSKITAMPDDSFLNGNGLSTHYVDLINVSGTGSLTLVVGGETYEDSKGVYIAGGNLNMLSGSITAVAAEVSTDTGVSHGVYVDGDLTMEGGSELIATGGAAEYSYGVYTDGDLTMKNDSELTATGGEADGASYGVCTYGDLTMSGGSITATGGESTDYGDDDDYESCGVYVYGKVEMTGAGTSITATGGSVAGDKGYSRGLGVVNGDLAVSGGNITATGGSAAGDNGYSRGLGVENGGLTVNEGGSIDATGGDATGESGESYGVMVFKSLEVSGNGSVKGTGGSADIKSYGVQAIGANTGGINVSGSKLIGNGGSAEEMSAGVYLTVGNLTVTNGSVTGKGGDAGYTSAGVYLNGRYEAATGGDLTVNGGSVSGTGGKATGTEVWPGSSAGIAAMDGSVTVTNGSVTGTGGEARDTYRAAEGEGNVANMQSGSVGIMAVGGVAINGGSITATGGRVTGTENYPGMSIGIAAMDAVTMNGGTTVAQGETGAFMATPTVSDTFEGATVWFGESADAANAGNGTPAGDIADTVYTNNKYVRIAASGSEPPVSVATEYPVWVGGVQFTIDKLTLSGDKGEATLTVDDTDPANPAYTLKLNGYEFIGAGHEGAAIYSEVPLTIELVGENSVISYGSNYGVYVAGALTVKGTGVLTAIGDKSVSTSYGIKAASIDVTGNVHLTAEGKTAWGKVDGSVSIIGGVFKEGDGDYLSYDDYNIKPTMTATTATLLGIDHCTIDRDDGEDTHDLYCSCAEGLAIRVNVTEQPHTYMYIQHDDEVEEMCALCWKSYWIKLVAPDSPVYNGQAHEVSIDALESGTPVDYPNPSGAKLVYEYTTDATLDSSGLPVDAGNVVASMTFTGALGTSATATVTYTITPNGGSTPSTPNTPSTPDDDDDDTPSTPSTPSTESVTVPISGEGNTIHVDASVSGDKATIDEVDLSDLNKVIGDHVEDVGTVTIDFSGLDSSEPITTVELPADVIKQIADAVNDPTNDAQSLEIILSDGTSIEFDAVALGEKAAQADGLDITISIKNAKDAKPNQKQEAALKGRPAYEISVTSGGEHISNFGGTITVHAPYELQDGEHPRGIIVWYVDGDGNRERCQTSYDSVKKRVNWKTDHLSLYMIDYDPALAETCDGGEGCPSAKFIDVDTSLWYHEAIDYAIENGLMGGYGNGYFGPNDDLSRGMLAQILYNLEGKPAVSGVMPFTDVAEGRYYYNAIIWMKQNGIAGGYGGGLFGPDDNITREQLAVMLWRYAQHKGYDVSVGENTNILSYEDTFDISEYAIPAMQWACGAGVMGGYGNGYLGPNDGATRAHVAQMLKSFMEKATK